MNRSDYINEFESFCRSKNLEYKRKYSGVVIRNVAGEYCIHIYLKWKYSLEGRKAIIGFRINSKKYKLSNINSVHEYSIESMNVRDYLESSYPNWLYNTKSWITSSHYN